MDVKFVQAESGDELATVAELFREYEAWLDDERCFTNLRNELVDMPGRYAAPDGRLLLVVADGDVVGCGALRRFDDHSHELKRIYLREQVRGFGIGRRLVEWLIAEALKMGSTRIVLDTLPKMEVAIRLYEELGFRPTADQPLDGFKIIMERTY